MMERTPSSQSHRAARWSRRGVIFGLTALGIAEASGHSSVAGTENRTDRVAATADRACRVAIDTALGTIEVLLELSRAPISAGDFLRYVDRGLYAGGSFYRTVRPDDDPKPIKIEVVQGGLTDESKFLNPIAHEATNRTGLRHRDGTISIGRDRVGTGTAGAFFVCIGDQPELDFGGRRNPDGQGFAAFGRVTSGMTLIRAIGAMKTQGDIGTPKGELIANPVAILGTHRV